MSIQFYLAKKQGYYLKINDNVLSSQVDPINESKRIINSIEKDVDQSSVYFCIGFSPVYHILYLLKYAKKIYVIDPRIDDYFFLKTLPDELTKLVLEDKIIFLKDIEDLKKLPLLFDLKEIKIIDTIKKLDGFEDWKKKILITFQKQMRSRLTENYFEKTWINNSISNLSSNNLKFISDFKIKQKKSFALISSGVNLHRDIKRIKNKRKSLFIIAVISTAKYLIKNDIIPDLFISSDGGFYNDYHFHFIYEFNLKHEKKIPLIAPLSLQRNILHYYSSDVYFYIDDQSVLKSLLKDNNFDKELKETISFQYIPMNPSITISALYLMRYWRIHQFYISGIDFELFPFSYHCKGNVTEELFFQRSDYYNTFETYYYNTYYSKVSKLEDKWTTEILELYKKEFYRVAESFNIRLFFFSEDMDQLMQINYPYNKEMDIKEMKKILKKVYINHYKILLNRGIKEESNVDILKLKLEKISDSLL